MSNSFGISTVCINGINCEPSGRLRQWPQLQPHSPKAHTGTLPLSTALGAKLFALGTATVAEAALKIALLSLVCLFARLMLEQ
jgi:hypothetical protein